MGDSTNVDTSAAEYQEFLADKADMGVWNSADYYDEKIHFEGSAEIRALTYTAYYNEFLMGLATGERRLAPDELALLIYGLQNDHEAVALATDGGEQMAPPQMLGQLAYIAGDYGAAIDINRYWGDSGLVYNEPVFDMALQAAVGGVIGLARTAATYGVSATIKGIPWLAARQSGTSATSVGARAAGAGARHTVNGLRAAWNAGGNARLAAQAAIRGKSVSQYIDEAMLAAQQYGRLEATNPRLWTNIQRVVSVGPGKLLSGSVLAGFPAIVAEYHLNRDAYDTAEEAAIATAESVRASLEASFRDDLVDPLYLDDLIRQEAQLYAIANIEPNTEGPSINEAAERTGLTNEMVEPQQAPPTAPAQASGNPQTAWEAYYAATNPDGSGPYNVTLPSGETRRVDLGRAGSIEELDAMLAGAQGVGATSYEDDPLIGVPEGFIAQAPSNLVAFDRQRRTGPGVLDPNAMSSATGSVGGLFNRDPDAPGANQGSPSPVAAIYNVSDTGLVLYNMTPAQIEQTQRAMKKAGLLDDEAPGFLYGSVDSQTLNGMTTTMGNANNLGRSWVSTLEMMGDYYQDVLRKSRKDRRSGSGARRAPFTPSTPYIGLDPAEAAQAVKNTIEQRLGRKANDWEVREIGAEMEATHREAYDVKIDAERAIYNARGRGTDKIIEEFEGVDEGSRFEENFETRYDTELGEVDRWAAVKRDSGALFAGLNRMSQGMGGV